mgnify:CR=1 FL=1
MKSKTSMGKKYDNQTVSVIIPVYNSERYIKETIDSVLEQTYKQVEIIVIDDCSSDNSKRILNDLVQIHSNVIYHRQEKNQGVAIARNTGLQMAKGRYVAFLDSDDIWKKDKLEKQLSLMQAKHAGFVFSAIEMMDENGNERKKKRKIKTEVDYNYLLKNTVIPTSTVVIDRNIVENFKMPHMRSGQDYATWLMILRDGIIAYGVDEALVRYRVGSNSLSSNKFKSIKQVWGIQVYQEKINPVFAIYNTGWFIVHALKKYLV